MFKWSAPWVWYLLFCVTEQGGDIRKEPYLCMLSCSLRLSKLWGNCLLRAHWVIIPVCLPKDHFLAMLSSFLLRPSLSAASEPLHLQCSNLGCNSMHVSGGMAFRECKKEGKKRITIALDCVGHGSGWRKGLVCCLCTVLVEHGPSPDSGLVGKWKQFWGSGLPCKSTNLSQVESCICTIFCRGW